MEPEDYWGRNIYFISKFDNFQISGEIFNLSDKNISIGECIKNNWWMIGVYDKKYVEEFLNFHISDCTKEQISSSSNHNELIITNFVHDVGSPTHIYQYKAPLRIWLFYII